MTLMVLALLPGVVFGESGTRMLADFPAKPGEADDTARIQRAVDATPSGVLRIPGGLYRISSTIMVTNRCSLELHKTAVLRAVKAMSGMPTALGRAGEVEELVNVILFMCSENASFITGTNHVVDGGRLCMYQPYVAPKS